MYIVIDRLWDGSAAAAAERIALELRVVAGGLELLVDAPFHDDPPPAAPVGRTPGLWEHEVVELFLHGEGDRYLEVELGPRGHWLALALHGVRHVVDADVPLEFVAAAPERGRWHGRAVIARAHLPPGLARWNAHAIHGRGDARRYLSALPAGGARPDFHRPDVAEPLERELLDRLSLET